jgi:hypothetical protein
VPRPPLPRDARAPWRATSTRLPSTLVVAVVASLSLACEPASAVPASERIEELVRSDQVITRFDRAAGALIAFDPDGTIRTFFRTNDGEAYFRRQARRRPTS